MKYKEFKTTERSEGVLKFFILHGTKKIETGAGPWDRSLFSVDTVMDNIRALGRKIYFEDLHKKSRTAFFSARRQLEDAEKKGKGVEEARASVISMTATLDHIEAILLGEIQEENPDWAMYEAIGQKEKEAADKYFAEYMNRNPVWINKS